MNIQLWLLSMEYKSYRISGWSVIPVSYTHLDVYKRQIQGTGDFLSQVQREGMTGNLQEVEAMRKEERGTKN